MSQALKPLCLTKVGRIPFSHFQPSSLWGNKNSAPQYKDVEVGKFREQNWLNRRQMVQIECPRVTHPLVSFTFEELPFPIFGNMFIKLHSPAIRCPRKFYAIWHKSASVELRFPCLVYSIDFHSSTERDRQSAAMANKRRTKTYSPDEYSS